MEAVHVDQSTVVAYPVSVDVRPDTESRNRLTTAFRFFLALPHLLLVGGPVAVISSINWSTSDGLTWGWSSGGLLSIVVCLTVVIAWFAILFTGRYPRRLRDFATFYLRWRIRSTAYVTLLRDEYPPFGDGEYPVTIELPEPGTARDRVSVAFRIILAIPHLIVLWLLGLVWAFVTAVAWVMILVTGRYPEMLYGFAIGVLAWTARVEAYMLLLRDEYPPFTLRA
jgi:hypothetical protein